MKEAKEGELTYKTEDIFDEFTTFFVAGTDTTSNYLTMMIYLVYQHPEVEKKVRQEIAEHMKEDDFSYDNLKKMTYIDCVEKEVTRFYGPANGFLIRNVVRDHLLKNVPMKKDTFVIAQPLGVHYSEKYYKNPTEFRPERWIEECNNIPAFAIGGFSGGPRACIGKHLAKLEAKIGLIKFMQKYEKIDSLGKKVELIMKLIYGTDKNKWT